MIGKSTGRVDSSLVFSFQPALELLVTVDFTPSQEQGKGRQISQGWQTVSTLPVLKRIVWKDVLDPITIAGTVWIAANLFVFVSDALLADEKCWDSLKAPFSCG